MRLRPRQLWLAWAGQASALVLGVLCLASVAHAQNETATPGVGWREFFSVVGVLVSTIVGLWSRHQDKLIQDAMDVAKGAKAKADELQRQIDRDHRPAAEHARMLEAAIAPVRDQLNAQSNKIDQIQNRLINALLGSRQNQD